MAVLLKTLRAKSFLKFFGDFCAFIFRANCTIKSSLNLEDEGNTVLLHAKRHSVKNTACNLRKHESFEIRFLCPD
jgi:hypothetical protein